MREFTVAKRERLLALLAVGYSTEEACAVAGTSRQTVGRWAARGRAPGASPEHEEFAARLDAVREGLAEDVAARAEPVEEEPPRFGDAGYIDAMTWLEPERMAELTEEQRQRAREAYVAECDSHPPGWLSAKEWQGERSAILRGERDWSEPDERSRRRPEEADAADPWPDTEDR